MSPCPPGGVGAGEIGSAPLTEPTARKNTDFVERLPLSDGQAFKDAEVRYQVRIQPLAATHAPL